MDENKKNQSFNKIILNHIKEISIIVAVVVIIIPILVCIGLKVSTKYIPGNLLVVTEDINAWFSFLASYSGVIVSSAIGIITLYLTAVLDKINNQNTERQNKMSVATNMPNMECMNLRLYALSEADFPQGYLSQFCEENNHILVLEMVPAFPPYFSVQIEKICMRLKNPLTGAIASDKEAKIINTNYRITNNQFFTAVINIPEELNESMQNLYFMNILTTEGTEYDRKIVDMWIGFVCSNVLVDDSQANVKFNLHLEIVNEGRHDKGGIELKVVNRQFELTK